MVGERGRECEKAHGHGHVRRWSFFHDDGMVMFFFQGTIAIDGFSIELITFEILAAERLRLMAFDNRLIIDCFANVVNILIWQFSTNDRFKSEKYESITWKIHFQK